MSPIGSRGRAPRRLAMLLLLGAPTLTGCTEVESAAVDGYEPAKLEHVAGSDVQRVRFTSEGARRTGLELEPLVRRGAHTVAPYAALIYGPDGSSFVYTQPEPLTFERTEVEVEKVDGNDVLLSDGPRPGTRVVTVGAAEVYGTETGIAGGH